MWRDQRRIPCTKRKRTPHATSVAREVPRCSAGSRSQHPTPDELVPSEQSTQTLVTRMGARRHSSIVLFGDDGNLHSRGGPLLQHTKGFGRSTSLTLQAEPHEEQNEGLCIDCKPLACALVCLYTYLHMSWLGQLASCLGDRFPWPLEVHNLNADGQTCRGSCGR